MAKTYDQVTSEFDLCAIRDRLNDACGTDKPLDLTELQELRLLIERLARIQAKEACPVPIAGLRAVPGFTTLRAMRHGRLWYLVDCTETFDPNSAHVRTIGGYRTSYGAACLYADLWFYHQYH